VVYLSPPGQKRGVLVTHGLYPADELEKVRQAFASTAVPADPEELPARASAGRSELAAVTTSPAWAAEIAQVRAEVDEIRSRVEELVAELRELKSALGV
jgi:hypothetical protein